MSNPKDLPPDVPDEVKLVLSRLKPAPVPIAEKREQLLAGLEAARSSAQGSLQQLLEQVREVLLSTKPDAPFQPRFAREFSTALARYETDPDAPKPPPEILFDCLSFLRELVQARGLGPLLEAVDEVSPERSKSEAKARQQEEVKTRIQLGNTRG